jgi:hypothetical protein
MQAGQFADLVRDYASDALDQVMIDATRVCEGIAGRRLAPFTAIPETHRATGIDPDEGEVGRRRGARGSGPFPTAPSRTGQAAFTAPGSPAIIFEW